MASLINFTAPESPIHKTQVENNNNNNNMSDYQQSNDIVSSSTTASTVNNNKIGSGGSSNSNSSVSINNNNNSSDRFHVVAGSTPFVRAKEHGKVYKEATKRERDFYEMVQSSRSSLPIYQLIPRYYGVYNSYIILEDLTSGYSKPCIMDIKLGLTHHDLDLDILYPKPIENHESLEEQQLIARLKAQTHITKRNKSWLVSKYITTPLLGFCLCGYQKYNNNKKEFEKVTKEQGRYLNLTTIREKLLEFFHTGSNLRSDAIECLSQKLTSFKDYFENNPEFKFRSTSLLLIYEGDDSAQQSKCDIRLIDFAHATTFPPHLQAFSSELSVYTPEASCEDKDNTENCNNNDSCNGFFPIDGGYLFGVSNLLNIITSLSSETSQSSNQ
ncbi:hypothetical protein PPL_12438 [Heterostelium album PN500]|uniref:Kinase n=1 Tax=Heterostelium pallidum (strain ATCC 26659 / Pp 5 / PN500) TaxID=670386 RepID=D3BML6_HETP5|nr:hypothetical protein PPL_12438 [Heterostelium album PN500]EFA77228.1 hypothetical protein PPL_12438 [Heterostelium album PN500]|eukprot:XP_020429357.1 hypothetical protein PPL_12438 [Heterostelium album PN500]